jgi:hypothetical protein
MNLFELIESGDVTELIQSIKRGASIDNVSPSMRTLLHNACFHGHFEIIKALVKYGADLEAKDIMGWTALRYACAHGDLNIIQYLVEQGADINATSCRLWTSLHSAAGLGHIECCRYFIDRGADLSIKTIDGMTPLHVACVYGQKSEIVKYMIHAGADPETKDPHGNSSLQLACQIGNIDVVKTLLDLGSDPFQIKNTKFWNSRIVSMVEQYQERDKNRTETCRHLCRGGRAFILLLDRLSIEICFHILEFLSVDLSSAETRLVARVLMDRRSLGNVHPTPEQTWLSLLGLKRTEKIPFTNRLLLRRCRLYLEEE